MARLPAPRPNGGEGLWLVEGGELTRVDPDGTRSVRLVAPEADDVVVFERAPRAIVVTRGGDDAEAFSVSLRGPRDVVALPSELAAPWADVYRPVGWAVDGTGRVLAPLDDGLLVVEPDGARAVVPTLGPPTSLWVHGDRWLAEIDRVDRTELWHGEGGAGRRLEAPGRAAVWGVEWLTPDVAQVRTFGGRLVLDGVTGRLRRVPQDAWLQEGGHLDGRRFLARTRGGLWVWDLDEPELTPLFAGAHTRFVSVLP